MGQSKAMWQCKWRHLVTIFRSNASGAAKFQDFDQISGFRPNFRISTKFQNLKKTLPEAQRTQGIESVS